MDNSGDSQAGNMSWVIHDEPWFNGCSLMLMEVVGTLSRYQLHDPSTQTYWLAMREPWESTQACKGLEQCYRTLKGLDPEHLLLPVAFFGTAEGPVLLFPGNDSLNLGNLFSNEESRVGELLKVVHGAAQAVANVHDHSLLHCRIRPESFLVRRNHKVLLSFFGASPARELAPIALLSQQDWAYVAPEQARLAEAYIDVRSDLYSLGVVCYQLITGRLPLNAAGPAEWLHAHIAIQPLEPWVIAPTIPEVFGQIILKLIAKDPAHRYQSAKALICDLEYCSSQWAAHHAVNAFNLAQFDAFALNNRARILIGRASDLSLLKQGVSRIAATGQSELALVFGSPGSGKSALVETLASEIENDVCYFGMGKSDQLQREIPFAPLSQALRVLISQLMGQDQAKLVAMRERIFSGLAGQGALLADLVPEIELIIGKASALPDLPPHQTVKRLNKALLSTFAQFGGDGRPLVLFIDDIQWADPATLLLLETFLRQPPQNVLLIVAYRDEEVAHLETVRDLLTHARSSEVPVIEIEIKPLSIQAVTTLISTSLGASDQEMESVGNVIHNKTAGNPFFVNQVMRNLIDDNVLQFDSNLARWAWDIARVKMHRYADNVVDLMVRRLERLPSQQQELIRMIGCVGLRCEEELLRRLSTLSLAEIQQETDALVKAGLLVHQPGSFTLPHDRILEAAYGLTPLNHRPAQHAQIALLMIEILGDRVSDSPFEIANQIQRATKEVLPDAHRPLFVAALIAAARRSKAGAIEQSAEYLATARRLLGEDGWRTNYPLAFSAHWLECECQLLQAQLELAATNIEETLARAATPLDLALTYRLKATLNTLRSDYGGAITAALSGLEMLGIPLQRRPSKVEMDAAYQTVLQILGERSISDLGQLPKTRDPRIEIAMDLLSTLISSFFVNDGISFTHLAKMVELTLLHGTTPSCGYGFAWFGVKLAHLYGAYHDGTAFAEVALEIIDFHGYEYTRTAALVALDQVSAWTKPLDDALDKARQAIVSGHTGGDLGMACYACNHIVSDLLIMGEHLSEVIEEVEHGIALTRQFQYLDIERILLAQQRFAIDLSDSRPDPGTKTPRELGVDALGEAAHSSISQATLFWSYLYPGMSAFFYRDLQYALRCFNDAEPLAWSMHAHINIADYYLFSALTTASAEAPGETAAKLEKISALREHFVRWADITPLTFRNKLLLVDGEIARLSGQDLEAIRCYDQSAIAAGTAGFIHEKALAHELAAMHCEINGLVSGAHYHFRVARDCYRVWGAAGKVRQLEAHHAYLANDVVIAVATQAPKQNDLDMAVGIKAAQALSDEVLLDRLIETLMTHMIIHGGAEYGSLLLMTDNEPWVAASGRVFEGEVKVEIGSDQPLPCYVPLSVVNSILLTRKPLVLADARDSCPSVHRSELTSRSARSVLCLPLLKQGSLRGLLYLENGLAPGVFNPERMSMLEILASQALISLETARLYARMIEESKARAQMEADLRTSRAELARSSHLIVMAELSASIAHEISQPLLGIVSNAAASLRWLNREQPDINEAVFGLEDIRADGLRAGNIIRALRSLAKQTPANLSVTSIDDIITDVLRLTSTEVEHQGIRLVVHTNASHAKVYVDRVQIQQLLCNLIANAVDALSAGASVDRTLTLTSAVLESGIEVRVQDNGTGITEDVLKQMFDPFYTTKGNGMGMGLAICRSITKAHQGTLAARIAEGGGCVLTFTLPIAPATNR